MGDVMCDHVNVHAASGSKTQIYPQVGERNDITVDDRACRGRGCGSRAGVEAGDSRQR